MASIKVYNLLTSVKPFDLNGEPSSIGGDGNNGLKVFRYMPTARASSSTQTKLTIKCKEGLYF